MCNKPHQINLCCLLQHVFLCASFSHLLCCLYTWHTHTTNSEWIKQLRPVSDMAENDRIFYCDCPGYCKTHKWVSSLTWYNHKKYRDNVMIPFGAFEAAAGAGPSAVPASPPLKQPQLYAETSGRPLWKCQRQNGPKSNANMASANQEVNIILLFSWLNKATLDNVHYAIQGGDDIPQNLERYSWPPSSDIASDLLRLIEEGGDHSEQQNENDEEPDGLHHGPEPEVTFVPQLADLQTSQ